MTRLTSMPIENKLAHSLGILFETRQYLNTSTRVQLYYSTFHAYLSYGLIIWGYTFKSYLNKISSLQNKAVRVIYVTIDGQTMSV